MEFITAEQFQEQPKEVQQVFLDWWKPSVGDLIGCNTKAINSDWKTTNAWLTKCITEDDIFNYPFKTELLASLSYIGEHKYYDKIIPLFTEGQLRNFIENKLEQIHYQNDGRKIELDITHNNNFTRIEEGVIGSIKNIKRVEWAIENELGKKYNLLQAYWKVACMIAKELL